VKPLILLLDCIVVLENVLTIVAAVVGGLLHSQAYIMTGPGQMHYMNQLGLLMIACIFSALLLGASSLMVLRIARQKLSDSLFSWSIWVYVSLVISGYVLFYSFLPTYHG
jgi:hypothetical protein